MNIRRIKKIKKVLLITPPYHSGVVECAGKWIPLGFVYLAGALRKAGFEPLIYDAMSNFDDHNKIQRRILEERPDIVATTAFTAAINASLKILSDAKKINEKIITVLGGVHPTFLFREILLENSFVDYIVVGEGEETFPELLDCLESEGDVNKVHGIAFRKDKDVVFTGYRNFISDLNRLTPAWDLIDWGNYTYRTQPDSTLAIVSSSRGCMQSCSFCSQQVFWKKTWRARTPENFVDEIEYLARNYGVNVAMICDEFPTADRGRWERILDLLIERDLEVDLLMETRVDDIIRDEDIIWKYRKAGVTHIYVGVESGNQTMLNIFNKNIKVEESRRAIEIINQHGIISETSFVLGMPEDTSETINETLELAKLYNPDMAFFLAIAPWSYSEIYYKLKPYIYTYDYSKYNLIEPVLKPVNMTIDELRDSLLETTEKFFMWKFKNLHALSVDKQNFMKKVLQILIEYSYLGDVMKRRFKKGYVIPDEMKKLIQSSNFLIDWR